MLNFFMCNIYSPNRGKSNVNVNLNLIEPYIMLLHLYSADENKTNLPILAATE